MPNPEKTMENCILMLQHIQEDSSIPRNIRRVADETRTLLTNNNKAMGLRAAEAISKIDEISNDPNMPIHARTGSGSWSRSWRRSRWTNPSHPYSFLARFRARVIQHDPTDPVGHFLLVSSVWSAGQKLQIE